jgi:transposase
MTLVFVDEAGFSLRPSVRKTWAPKGKTPILRHRFNWKRLHAIGAIACRADGSDPQLLLHLQPESIKSDAVVGFLEQVQHEITGKVLIIWDGLPAHRSKIVKGHLEGCGNALSVTRFPAYAPELNPVEYLWSTVKGRYVANRCPDYIADLETAVVSAKEKIAAERDTLSGFLRASRMFE